MANYVSGDFSCSRGRPATTLYSANNFLQWQRKATNSAVVVNTDSGKIRRSFIWALFDLPRNDLVPHTINILTKFDFEVYTIGRKMSLVLIRYLPLYFDVWASIVTDPLSNVAWGTRQQMRECYNHSSWVRLWPLNGVGTNFGVG